MKALDQNIGGDETSRNSESVTQLSALEGKIGEGETSLSEETGVEEDLTPELDLVIWVDKTKVLAKAIGLEALQKLTNMEFVGSTLVIG